MSTGTVTLVAAAAALAAAFLNAAFGICLGCEVYLLARRAHGPRHRPHGPQRPRRPLPHGGSSMSTREQRPGRRRLGRGAPRRPEDRPRRGRRGHRRLRQEPHQGRGPAGLEEGPAGPGPPRLREQGAVRGAAVRARHRQRRHRRALRRQQQLVRGLRLLVLQALRPRRRQAARRRPQEVGAGLPRAGRPSRRRAPATTYTAKDQDRSIRAFRDEVEAAIGQKNLVDVRSPDEFAGRLLAPAHLPQEQAQRNGHIPTAANIPWSQTANDDGTFKSDDELTKLYEDKGVDLGEGHHRLLPDRRAVVAHLVRAARAPRAAEREELRRLVDRVGLAGRRADRARGPSPDVRREGAAAPRPRAST